MSAVYQHYERIEREAESQGPAHRDIPRPIVILPLQRWGRVSEKALQFAYTLSRDLVVVHIAPENQDGVPFTGKLTRVWEDFIDKPRAGSWFQGARIGDLALSVSVGHNSDFSICTGDGAQAPGRPDCRTCSGARGVALVLLFPSQSACGCSESASLCERHGAHNRHQRAVVYAVLSQASQAVL